MTRPADLLTTREAAKILGVTPQRVVQLCVAGRLGRKVGRDWLIPHAEVLAFERRAGGWPKGRPRSASHRRQLKE